MMNEIEKMVWAAAFAAAFQHELDFRQRHARAGDIDGISGSSCAETADVALQKYREAMVAFDCEYLTPVKEGWVR